MFFLFSSGFSHVLPVFQWFFPWFFPWNVRIHRTPAPAWRPPAVRRHVARCPVKRAARLRPRSGGSGLGGCAASENGDENRRVEKIRRKWMRFINLSFKINGI
jgi:hypothetical protein